MDDAQKAVFNAAVVAYLADKGELVGKDATYYGWQDYEGGEAKEHIRACGVAPGAVWDDKTWREFVGTFAPEGEDYQRGIELHMSCRCGRYEDRDFRYTGGHAALLRGITGTK